MDQAQKLPQSNNTNGFFLGVIVGAFVTALFTTQKGKEILKEITDKSIESWDDVEKALEKMELDVDDSPTTEYVSPEGKREINNLAQDSLIADEVKQSQKNQKEVKNLVVEKINAASAPEVKNITGRRWFRGLKKRA